MKVLGRVYFLPLNSITAFVWGIIVTYDWNKFPSFLLFSVGWLFLTTNGYINRDPSPWKQIPAYTPGLNVLFSGKLDTKAIAPYQNLQSSLDYEAEVRKKRDWMKKERDLLNEHKEQIQTELAGMEGRSEYNSVLDITSPSTHEGLLMKFLFPVKRVLYPIQIKMRRVVIGLRISTSVLIWEESYWAFWLTTASFLGSLFIFKIPFAYLLRWIMRIVAWVFLGPWMIIVDRKYFKSKSYGNMTDDERDEEIQERMRVQYETFLKQATNHQIRREKILKLKSMKNYMVGSLTEIRVSVVEIPSPNCLGCCFPSLARTTLEYPVSRRPVSGTRHSQNHTQSLTMPKHQHRLRSQNGNMVST